MYPDKFTIKRVWRRGGAQSVTDDELNEVSNGNEKAALRSILACVNRYRMIAVDTETTGLDPNKDDLVLITIATPDTAWVFDRDTWPGVLSILGDRTVTKLLHYAPFDWGFIVRHCRTHMSPMWDTRRAFANRHKEYADKGGSSLSDMARTFLDLTLDKSMATAFVGAQRPYTIDSRHVEYAGIDALILWPLCFSLLSRGYVISELKTQAADFTEMSRYLEGRLDVLPARRQYGSLR